MKRRQMSAAINIAATNTVIALGGVVSGVLVARILGPAGRGDLAVILLCPGILGYVAALGSDIVLGRWVARDPENGKAAIAIATVLSFVYSAALLIALYPFLSALLPSDKQEIVAHAQLALLAVPALVFNLLLGGIALGAGKFWMFNFGRISVTGTYVALLVTIWLTRDTSLKEITGAYLVAVWCGAVLTIILLSQSYGRGIREQWIKEVGPVMKSSVIFAPAYVIFAITNNLSAIWLAWLADSHSLGLYVVALTLANGQQVVAQALAKVAFSTAAQPNAASDSPSQLAATTRRSISILLILALALILIAPLVVPLLFGYRFESASSLLIFLAPAVALYSASQIMDETLKARGIAAPSTLTRIISGCVTSACAFVLIPRCEAAGMALSYLAGAVSELLAFAMFWRRSFNLRLVDIVVPRLGDWLTRRK